MIVLFRLPRLATLSLALGALMLGGCGYSTKELFPKQYQTVAVPMFENRTFQRGVEFDLSEALVKELESRTPYKVTAPSTADTMLTGTITDIERETLSRTPEPNLPQQQEIVVTVDFEWKNLNTGRTLRSRRGFEAVGRYVPTRPVGQPFETAQHRAVQSLAREIVATMQVGLGEPDEEADAEAEAEAGSQANPSTSPEASAHPKPADS